MKKRNRYLLGGGLVLLVALLLVAFVPISYYSFAPGNAIAVEDQIHLDNQAIGRQGHIFMTDVNLMQLTLGLDIIDSFNKNIDIYPASAIFGSSNPGQIVTQQVGQMIDAKTAAVIAAYSYAGRKYTILPGVEVISTLPQTSPSVLPGDLIVAVNGESATTLAVVAKDIEKAGSLLTLTVYRSSSMVGSPVKKTITLHKFLDQGRQVIGVTLAPSETVELQKPFAIETGQIGGPSAGLAFTLGILQQLGAIQVASGKKVAVTGTISPDGTVGDVGGVKQKAVAVYSAGVRLFIVPDVEVAAANSAGIKGLKVVGVKTLVQAIDALMKYKVLLRTHG
ncbi:MAG: hypothetical protein M0019_05135 [Actinomycetota bacterium]|nr:hypothetical protein [Actinomycetota bacterium]